MEDTDELSLSQIDAHEAASARQQRREEDEDAEDAEDDTAAPALELVDASADLGDDPGDADMDGGVPATVPTASPSLEHAEMGTIEKVELENFMCHRYLEIEFCPNVNFLVGDNGSGKSAVLVGIAMCLGSKAMFTARAHSVKDLIREGAQWAKVSVRLRNRGAEAYMPHAYGSSIVVERRWTRDGGTTYKLRGASGKTVATGMGPLRAILDHYGIQIGNPCVLLMQDTAKQFLFAEGPKKKYEFFLKATMLETIATDYASVSRDKETMEGLLPDMERQVQTLHQEIQDLQQLRQLASEIDDLKNRLAWAWVVQQQKAVTKAEERLTAAASEVAKAQKEIDTAEKTKGSVEGDMEQLTAVLTETKERVKAAEARKASAEAELASRRREASTHQARERDLTKRCDQKKNQQRLLAQNIAEARKRSADQISKEKEERLALIEERKAQLAELQEQFRQAEADVTRMETESLKAGDAVRKAEGEISDLRGNMSRVSAQMRSFEDQKRDRLRFFGENMSALMEAVKGAQKSGTLRGPVIGPLGLHIRLTDNKWATAIETVIRREALASFVVSCKEDLHALDQIMRKCNCRIQIYQQRFRDHIYDIRNAPPSDVLTIQRAVEVDDPNVMNVLIDHFHVEDIALVEERDDADKLIRARVRGVREVYTANGSRIFEKNGSLAFFGARGKQNRFFGVDLDSNINECKEQIEGMQARLPALEQEKRRLEQERHDGASKFNAAKRKAQAINRELAPVKAEIMELEAVKDEDPPDVSEMEQQLEVLRGETEAMAGELETIRAAIKAAAESTRPQQEELSRRTQDLENVNDELEIAQNKLQKAILVQETHEKRIAAAREKRDRMQETQLRATDALQKQQEELDRRKLVAREIYAEELEPDEPPEQLDKQIRSLEAHLEKQREGKTREIEDVQREFDEAQQRLDSTRAKCCTAREIIEEFNAMLRDRRDRWSKFLKSITNRTRYTFNGALLQKGYSGDIEINHKEKTINITVVMGKSNFSDQGARVVKDTRTLSGGERSFSTVALLVSLWEAIESPFCAMDEFDVFMDSVNRQVSVKLLLEFARVYRNRQYIFISPQSDLGIQASPTVKIIRLKAPERDQSIIQFHNRAHSPSPAPESSPQDDPFRA
eukprot:m51a1_g9519 putative structural maintenance of chromosomes protein 6-like (1133) ;mRNA; f:748137-752408